MLTFTLWTKTVRLHCVRVKKRSTTIILFT